MSNIIKEATIVISEPWDFESPDGKNIIKGTIISILNKRIVIFKANYMLNFNCLIGNILVLSSRIKNVDIDIFEIDLHVNGGLLLVDFDEKLEESQLKEKCKFVLIGHLK